MSKKIKTKKIGRRGTRKHKSTVEETPIGDTGLVHLSVDAREMGKTFQARSFDEIVKQYLKKTGKTDRQVDNVTLREMLETIDGPGAMQRLWIGVSTDGTPEQQQAAIAALCSK